MLGRVLLLGVPQLAVLLPPKDSAAAKGVPGATYVHVGDGDGGCVETSLVVDAVLVHVAMLGEGLRRRFETDPGGRCLCSMAGCALSRDKSFRA